MTRRRSTLFRPAAWSRRSASSSPAAAASAPGPPPGLATTQVLAPRFGRLLTWTLAAGAINDFLQAGFAALDREANELEHGARRARPGAVEGAANLVHGPLRLTSRAPPDFYSSSSPPSWPSPRAPRRPLTPGRSSRSTSSIRSARTSAIRARDSQHHAHRRPAGPRHVSLPQRHRHRRARRDAGVPRDLREGRTYRRRGHLGAHARSAGLPVLPHRPGSRTGSASSPADRSRLRDARRTSTCTCRIRDGRVWNPLARAASRRTRSHRAAGRAINVRARGLTPPVRLRVACGSVTLVAAADDAARWRSPAPSAASPLARGDDLVAREVGGSIYVNDAPAADFRTTLPPARTSGASTRAGAIRTRPASRTGSTSCPAGSSTTSPGSSTPALPERIVRGTVDVGDMRGNSSEAVLRFKIENRPAPSPAAASGSRARSRRPGGRSA